MIKISVRRRTDLASQAWQIAIWTGNLEPPVRVLLDQFDDIEALAKALAGIVQDHKVEA